MAKSTSKETVTSEKFFLHGRLSFPKLDKPKPYEEGSTPRWESTLILDPSDSAGLDSIKLLLKVAREVSEKSYSVVPLALKRLAAAFIPGVKAPTETKEDGIVLAFYDGTAKAESNDTYEAYKGMLIVPAHEYESRKDGTPGMKPRVVNRRGITVDPGEEQYPYSGCYAIMSVSIWGSQNAKYAKRLGVNLRGVQFKKDGEAFGGGGGSVPEDEFEALEDSGTEVATEDWDS